MVGSVPCLWSSLGHCIPPTKRQKILTVVLWAVSSGVPSVASSTTTGGGAAFDSDSVTGGASAAESSVGCASEAESFPIAIGAAAATSFSWASIGESAS